MKKQIIALLLALCVLSTPLTADAQEEPGCTISAGSAVAAVGDMVTIEVKIAENPGFSNLAIALDYDRECLKLEHIDTADAEGNPYLCGDQVSANAAWSDGEKTYGYVTCASDETIVENGVLFTASFTVLKKAVDAQIQPIVKNLRAFDVESAQFSDVSASATTGLLSANVRGDVNGDDSIGLEDAEFVYRYINEALDMLELQLKAADVNRDMMVDTTDAALIYRYVNETLAEFPVNSAEEES